MHNTEVSIKRGRGHLHTGSVSQSCNLRNTLDARGFSSGVPCFDQVTCLLRAKPKYSTASEKKTLAPTVSEEITTPRFYFCSSLIITITKFSKSDWLSTVLIFALIGRCNGTVRAIAHACLNGLFSLLAKKNSRNFLRFNKKIV